MTSPRSSPRWRFAALAVAAASLLVAASPRAPWAQSFGRNKVQYQNFDWRVLSTPHFEIFFYDEAVAAHAALIAEDAYVRLSKVFHHQLSSQIPFILYASPNDFQQTNISDELIGEATGGFSEPARNRMVLPYPGDNHTFLHVINHELVHVFMFDIAYHSTAKGAARRALFPIPLWFAEGAAEWFSSGWDKQADMWIRDATVYDWLAPLPYVGGGFQVYKEGQAAMRYLAKTYGDEKVVELFKNVGRTRDLGKALETTIGLDEQAYSERWVKAMKQEYWPLYANKQEPETVGRRLTDHEKERAYFNQHPCLSPDGRYVAFFSDRSGLVDLFLMNAADGTLVRKLITGYKSNRFLSLHSFESSIGFSGSGDRICFIAKSGPRETLYVVRVDNGKVVKSIPLGMDMARSPAWSPAADLVVLSGTRSGRTDLYLIDLHSGKIDRLTDDAADELSPAWYPSGDRVLYSAYPGATADVRFSRDEHGITRLEPVDFASDKNVERDGHSYDLWSIDLLARKPELVVASAGDDTDPVVVDDSTIVFVSDASGVSNLYFHDLKTRKTHRFSDVLGGLFHPTVSASADRLIFTAFNQGGFDLFLMENFRAYAQEHPFADPIDPKVLAIASAAAAPDSSDRVLALLTPRTSAQLPVTDEAGPAQAGPASGAGPGQTSGATIGAPTGSAAPTETGSAPTATTDTAPPAEAQTAPPAAAGVPAALPPGTPAASPTGGAAPAGTATPAQPATGAATTAKTAEPPGPSAGASPDAAGNGPASGTEVGVPGGPPELAPAGVLPPQEKSTPVRRPIGSVERYSPRFSLDPIGGGGFGGVYYSSSLGFAVANVISFSDLLGNHRMQFLVNFYGSFKDSDLAASYYYLKRRVNYGLGVFHYRNYINSNFTSLGEVFEGPRLFSERNYGIFGLASMPFTQFDRVDLEMQWYTSDRTFYAIDDAGFAISTGSSTAQLVQPSLSFVHDTAFYGPHGPVTGTRWLVSFSPALPISDSSVKRTTSFLEYRRYVHAWYRNSFAFRLVGATSRGPDPRRFTVGGPSTLRGFDVFDFESTVPGTKTPRYANLLGRNLMLMNLEYRFPLVDYLVFGWPGRFGFSGIGATVFFDSGSAFDQEFNQFRFFTRDGGSTRLADLNADFGFGIRANVAWIPVRFDWGWKTDFASTGKPQFHFSIGPEF